MKAMIIVLVLSVFFSLSCRTVNAPVIKSPIPSTPATIYSAPSTTTQPSTSNPEKSTFIPVVKPFDYSKWIKIVIGDIGSINYPPEFMEVQSEDYKRMTTQALTSGKYGQILQILKTGATDFTLQQTGLNDLNPSSLNEYRRILFKTTYLSPGEETFRNREKYTVNQKELIAMRNELISQIQLGYEKINTDGIVNKIIDAGIVEVVEVNGMFPLVHTYKRQLNDNPIVFVKSYIFWNYNKVINISFSYRVEDEDKCKDYYDKILKSLTLN